MENYGLHSFSTCSPHALTDLTLTIGVCFMNVRLSYSNMAKAQETHCSQQSESNIVKGHLVHKYFHWINVYAISIFIVDSWMVSYFNVCNGIIALEKFKFIMTKESTRICQKLKNMQKYEIYFGINTSIYTKVSYASEKNIMRRVFMINIS